MVKYVVTGTTGGLGSQVFKYLLKLVSGTISIDAGNRVYSS